jgi:hypothetical protein
MESPAPEIVGETSAAWSTPPSTTVQFVVEVPTGNRISDVLAVTTGDLTFEQGVHLDDSSGHTTVGQRRARPDVGRDR